MKARITAVCILALCLIAGCSSQDSSARIKPDKETGPHICPASYSSGSSAAVIGTCRIKVLEANIWRDWMPMVEHPGPDGGSPLRAKVKLWLDNSSGQTEKLSFHAFVVTDKGQSYDLPLQILPDYRILPDKVFNKLPTSDGNSEMKISARYGVMWNGVLKKGESRVVELAVSEGPYLPVGSRVHIEIKCTNQKGESIIIKTPDVMIRRTD
jgi:hypothetical protein